jgi:hypothetical protein
MQKCDHCHLPRIPLLKVQTILETPRPHTAAVHVDQLWCLACVDAAPRLKPVPLAAIPGIPVPTFGKKPSTTAVGSARLPNETLQEHSARLIAQAAK